MTDYEPIDYRLRCHTKRTDLPSDVLRDIGEAYAYITNLQDQVQRLRDKHDSLLATNEELEARNKNMEDDYFRIRTDNE